MWYLNKTFILPRNREFRNKIWELIVIKKNKFYLESLSSVVFLGQSGVFSELIKINNKLNLETIIITSSDQSKLIDKKIDFKVFDNLDKKFKDFINKKIKKKKYNFYKPRCQTYF